MTAPVNTQDVYVEIDRHLGPELTRLGYRRGAARGIPWWVAEDSDGRVFMSAQVDSKATDVYKGGGFRIRLEKGSASTPDAKLTGRAILFQLLTVQETDELLATQNAVIASRPIPPDAHVDTFPAFLRPQYLANFQPQDSFTTVRSWLRYGTIADVVRWMEVLVPLLPRLDQRARATLTADQMYLGTGRIVVD